jgi:hypothetical protein
MKSVWSVAAAVAMMFLASGCETEKTAVISLNNPAGQTSLEQMTTVTERGTYYLYSSRDEHKPLYQTELRRGDPIGFKVNGNHIRAIAKGMVVDIPDDDAEGATYVWKLEKKKE